MKDRIYILFNRNGIRSLLKKTKNMKSIPSGTYMAELNLEVDNMFFDNKIPKVNIKLEAGQITKLETETKEEKPTPLEMFFSEL